MKFKRDISGHTRIHPNGSTVIVHSKETKKEAVESLDNGELTIKEVKEKYKIQNTGTIYNWLRNYSKKKSKYLNNRRATIQEKIGAVSVYEQGLKSKDEICEEFKIIASTFNDWLKLYSCASKPYKTDSTVKDSKDKVKGKKELEEARLKIASLETMISIAEKEFNIQIRKKCGTKQ